MRLDDGPGPSDILTAWSSVLKGKRRLSIPLFDPETELPLRNQFAPLVELDSPFPPLAASSASNNFTSSTRKCPASPPLCSRTCSPPNPPPKTKRPRVDHSAPKTSTTPQWSSPAPLSSQPASALLSSPEGGVGPATAANAVTVSVNHPSNLAI